MENGSSRSRLEALRQRLLAEGVSAIVLVNVVNVGYCTGFRRVFDSENAHAALVSESEQVLFTDSRYSQAASDAAAQTAWQVRLPQQGDVVSAAVEHARAGGAGRVALESSLSHGRFERTHESSGVEIVAAEGWVEDLRVVKSDDEIARIERAQALTDLAFDHIVSRIRAGATERDVALDLEFFMRREGSEGVAFSPIVAGGPHSALPHATVTDRELCKGDLVVLDFGARVDDYCADMTRTVCVGPASSEQRRVYESVLAANLAGIGAVRPGRLGSDVDRDAREVLVSRGLGERFGHGLGHGVGREVHEAPSVGPRGQTELRAGCVVTIEPGAYIPGFGGVRIEDLVVVEARGARVLTRSTKELLEL